MQFRLKTLLGLVTVACVLIAVAVSITNHRTRVSEHRMGFLRVDDRVSSLDSELHQHILRIPAVAAQLQKANPVDPPMAMGQSVMGESKAFGTYEFTRSFHYDWQLLDGSRCKGIKITVDSVLQEDSLDDHVVRLTYEASPLNDEVASWIGEQLQRDPHVRVEHIKTRSTPMAGREPASEAGVSTQGWSAYGGIR